MKKLYVTCLMALILTACSNAKFESVNEPTPSPTPAPVVQPSNQGLSCDVYSIQASDEQGTVNWDTMLANGTYQFNTILSNLDVPNESSNNVFSSFTTAQQALIGTTNYALDCEGYITVPETANYTFTQGSDDGSMLAIDNNTVINMPQLQAFTSQTATIQLFAGVHKINVIYFQGPPVMIGLTLSWSGDNNQNLGTISVVPSTALSH